MQAAYLVGVSDPSSTPARVGIVDIAKFSRSAVTVREACERVLSGHYTQQQIVDVVRHLEDAGEIEINTSGEEEEMIQ